VAQDLVSERERSVNLRDRLRFGDDFNEDVEAFGPVLQLVGKGPATPAVDTTNRAAPGAHELGDTVRRRSDVVLIQADIEDDGNFVWPQGGSPPPDPASATPGAPVAPEQG